MREILFKAKRKDDAKWVEGYFAIICEKTVIIEKESEKYYSIDDEKNSCGNRITEINPETLCQFTGLCDKNGKKIWENDILMAHLDESYPEDATYETVEWGVAGFVTYEAGSTDREYLDEFDLEYFEVVGNVFDNPELLQEESDE